MVRISRPISHGDEYDDAQLTSSFIPPKKINKYSKYKLLTWQLHRRRRLYYTPDVATATTFLSLLSSFSLLILPLHYLSPPRHRLLLHLRLIFVHRQG